MKKIITLFLALSMAISASAGNIFSFGLKFGLSSDKARLESSTEKYYQDAVLGYQAGAVIRLDIPVVPIYIQPELLYSWGKFKKDGPIASEVRQSDFSVPLLVGVGFGSSKIIKVRANVGPVFNVLSDVKIKDTNFDGLKEAFRKPTVTWSAGIGLDIVGIMLDVRYNAQFKKHQTEYNGTSYTVRPQSWTFSLGYLF